MSGSRILGNSLGNVRYHLGVATRWSAPATQARDCFLSVHESGHALAAAAVGFRVTEIVGKPTPGFGAVCRYDLPPRPSDAAAMRRHAVELIAVSAAGDLAVDALEVSILMIGGEGFDGRWHSAGRDRADITRDAVLTGVEADGLALAKRILTEGSWAVDALAFAVLCHPDRRLDETAIRTILGPALADGWKDRRAPAPAPAARRPTVTPSRRGYRPGWHDLEYR